MVFFSDPQAYCVMFSPNQVILNLSKVLDRQKEKLEKMRAFTHWRLQHTEAKEEVKPTGGQPVCGWWYLDVCRRFLHGFGGKTLFFSNRLMNESIECMDDVCMILTCLFFVYIVM